MEFLFSVRTIEVNWRQFVFQVLLLLVLLLSCHYSLLLSVMYSLFFGPMNNPTLGPDVTGDWVTYLLLRLVCLVLKTTVSGLASEAGSLLSLDTTLFILIELILLCWPFLLVAFSSNNWPSTDNMTIKKRDNKQKSPLLDRELINMIHVKYRFTLLITIPLNCYSNTLFLCGHSMTVHCCFWLFLIAHYSTVISLFHRTINCYTNTLLNNTSYT